MDATERSEVTSLMTRLADGDLAAAVELYFAYGDKIGACIRHVARSRGARLPADDVRGLTIDVCTTMLPELARSWRPDGALPWTWARHRLANLIDAHVGAHAGPLDESRLDQRPEPQSFSGVDPEPEVTLARIARENQTVSLLRVAMDQALSEPERATLLRYELQRRAGDPSPAHTVGAELGLSAPAVRQRVSRAKRKLEALAGSEATFSPLADLPFVTPARRGARAA